MAPPDSDAQFKFLIACIKYSTAGKARYLTTVMPSEILTVTQIDFAQVATECEIVSKGAASKRYERLMKAHGITGNNSGARAGSAGPSEPSTPAPRKALPGNRPSGNKKRKLAARGSDLDDQVKTEVKAQVKAEVEEELAASDNTHGSYTLYPNNPFDAATGTHAMSNESYKSENTNGDDEALLISGLSADYGGPAVPITFVQQMVLAPPPDSFYGFINSSSDLQLPSPTSHPFTHEHDTDYSTQTIMPSDPALDHWLQHHQNTSFF